MQYLAERNSTKMYFLCAQHKIFRARGNVRVIFCFVWLLPVSIFAVAKLVGAIKLLNGAEYLMINEDPNRI